MDFRDVKEEDWQFILELRNNFFQNFQKQDSPIKQKNHIKYMKKQIKNKKFKQWIVVKNKIDVGYIRILDGDVSILLREEYQGKGFGTQILKLLEKQLSIPRKLIAIINSDNISSIKAFENAGYKLKTMTYEKNI